MLLFNTKLEYYLKSYVGRIALIGIVHTIMSTDN
jgi:hypothetical protein